MYGAEQFSDDVVARAVSGSDADRDCIADALDPQVRMMVIARLSPHPHQLDAVDEIAQEAMVGILKSLPTLRTKTVGSLKSLASAVVSRRVVDFLRRQKAARPGGRPVASLETTVRDFSRIGPLWQFLSAGGTSPLSAIARADQVSLVLAELARIKDDYREIITLAFFDQLATAQIAEQLGVSRRAASMMLLRALRALRRRITNSSRPGVGRADTK
jgi:RNA polymerase sigma factor (sigma-70 family)